MGFVTVVILTALVLTLNSPAAYLDTQAVYQGF
jgi:hypothetical protein